TNLPPTIPGPLAESSTSRQGWAAAEEEGEHLSEPGTQPPGRWGEYAENADRRPDKQVAPGQAASHPLVPSGTLRTLQDDSEANSVRLVSGGIEARSRGSAVEGVRVPRAAAPDFSLVPILVQTPFPDIAVQVVQAPVVLFEPPDPRGSPDSALSKVRHVGA